VVILINYIILDAMQLSKKYILTIFKTNSLSFHNCRNKASQVIRSILHELKSSVAPSVHIRHLSERSILFTIVDIVFIKMIYIFMVNFTANVDSWSPFEWPHGVRRESAAGRLLRLRVRIALGT